MYRMDGFTRFLQAVGLVMQSLGAGRAITVLRGPSHMHALRLSSKVNVHSFAYHLISFLSEERYWRTDNGVLVQDGGV